MSLVPTYIVVPLVVVALVAAAVGLRHLLRQVPVPKIRQPLGAAEQQVYWRLAAALPDYLLIPRARAADFLDLSARKYPAKIRELVHSGTAGFLVCNKMFVPLAVVTLTDSPSAAPPALPSLLQQAGLGVVPLSLKQLPPPQHIRKLVLAAFAQVSGGNNRPPRREPSIGDVATVPEAATEKRQEPHL